jgi:hypothetical protein
MRLPALRLPFLRMILSENRNCTFRDHARGGSWKGFLAVAWQSSDAEAHRENEIA